MTTRDLLSFIAFLVVAGAAAWLGLNWYKSRQVQAFVASADQRYAATKNLADVMDFYNSAPDMSCSGAAAGFQGAITHAFYHWGTKTRFDFYYPTTGTTMSEIYDDSGFYVWTNTSDDIRFISKDRFGDADVSTLFASVRNDEGPGDALFNADNCKPWKANPDAFELPAKLITRVILNS